MKSRPATPVFELRLTETVTVSPGLTFVLPALAEIEAPAALETSVQDKITQIATRTEISDLIFLINSAAPHQELRLTYLSYLYKCIIQFV